MTSGMTEAPVCRLWKSKGEKGFLDEELRQGLEPERALQGRSGFQSLPRKVREKARVPCD